MNGPPNAWTDADEAELDVLIWELVGRVPEHKTRCPRCQAGERTGFPCPLVSEAIEAVLDWRRGRLLLSRAAKARRCELAARLRALRAELDQLRAAA